MINVNQPEKVFNLFFYVTLGVITEVGGVAHMVVGTDEQKIKFLQDHVETDFPNAIKTELPDQFTLLDKGKTYKGIDFVTYRDFTHQGYALMIFEKLDMLFSDPDPLLVVITPVRDGKIFIEGREDLKQTVAPFPKFIKVDKQKEWYSGYIDEKGFHFDQLINDDFFDAIRILYNAKHNVSAMKLMMISIDTMAFLEYGDVPGNFKRWLQQYADLGKMNITTEELWEFRNSILHMTNLDSRKVVANSVERLMFYDAVKDYAQQNDEGKYFKFKDLLDCVALAISKWADTYNQQKEKFEIFLKRYDRIISDKRMTYVHYQ
ncbi:MAG: hypothetical protein E6H07_12900 [Bacteroidetes bacterium]|nr:MAG: hypothetical protein E6H07_12900 [Bacteroidota bacterium]